VSSSATDQSFASFLERSLELMRVERPDVFGELRRAGASRGVLVCVDGESIHLDFRPQELCTTREGRAADVRVATTSDAILDAIDGDATLAELALADRLDLHGSVDGVLAFHDVLAVYVHGAVRAPSFARLLREFRGARTGASATRPMAGDERSLAHGLEEGEGR